MNHGLVFKGIPFAESCTMFERILKTIKEAIHKRNYVMTLHSEEEMNDDDLAIYDIEHGILTGKIVERQKDRDSAEWKYRIKGKTLDGNAIDVIVKKGASGKLVIITVYLA
ncbi:MAG: DUF4258 domain-containing protein [Nitrospinota bacterium]